MNAFILAEPFVVRRLIPEGPSSLFTHDETAALEDQLLARLEAAPAGSLLAVDFEGVRMASEAARQFLRRAAVRVTSGELDDRYLVLSRLGTSRYNVKVMLLGEGLVMAHRGLDGPELLGQIEASSKETFAFVSTQGITSARDVFMHFGLASIAAATNRLSALAKLALVRRVGQRPIPGGGREFLFAAVH
jgi:hypothetical protein